MNMKYRTRLVQLPLPLFLLMVLISCHDRAPKVENDTVKTTAKMAEHVSVDLRSMIPYAADHGDKLNDSITLNYRGLLDSVYAANGYTSIWSDKQRWRGRGDSLFN